MVPTACGAEIQPETNPRWPTGTWSEIVAVSAAVSTQKPMSASVQQTPMPDDRRLQAEQHQRDGEQQRAAERSTAGGGRTATWCGRRARRSAGSAISANTPAMPEMTPKATTLSTQSLGLQLRLDLHRQQQLDRGELRHPDAQPGGGEGGDPAAGDRVWSARRTRTARRVRGRRAPDSGSSSGGRPFARARRRPRRDDRRAAASSRSTSQARVSPSVRATSRRATSGTGTRPADARWARPRLERAARRAPQ